jgi:hypothetical protein
MELRDVFKSILSKLPPTNVDKGQLGLDFHEQLDKLKLGNYELGDYTDLTHAILPLARRYTNIFEGKEVQDVMDQIKYTEGNNKWDIQNFMPNSPFCKAVLEDAIFVGELRVAWCVKRFYDSFR